MSPAQILVAARERRNLRKCDIINRSDITLTDIIMAESGDLDETLSRSIGDAKRVMDAYQLTPEERAVVASIWGAEAKAEWQAWVDLGAE